MQSKALTDNFSKEPSEVAGDRLTTSRADDAQSEMIVSQAARREEDGYIDESARSPLIKSIGLARTASSSSSPKNCVISESSPPESFTMKQCVEARFKGSKEYYSGFISKKNEDGTYHVIFDDGDEDGCVIADHIRASHESASLAPSEGDDSSVGSNGKVSIIVGDRVEARFKGDKMYFPGNVRAVNPDGTFSIAYDDGDYEESVNRTLIRRT